MRVRRAVDLCPDSDAALFKRAVKGVIKLSVEPRADVHRPRATPLRRARREEAPLPVAAPAPSDDFEPAVLTDEEGSLFVRRACNTAGKGWLLCCCVLHETRGNRISPVASKRARCNANARRRLAPFMFIGFNQSRDPHHILCGESLRDNLRTWPVFFHIKMNDGIQNLIRWQMVLIPLICAQFSRWRAPQNPFGDEVAQRKCIRRIAVMCQP